MVFTQARRNLLSNKLRLFLTSLAIVLGVGFVTGAFVLGDTINSAFDQVFSTDNSTSAVQVRGKKVVSDTDRKPVPTAVLDEVRGVPGVESAEGTIMGLAQVVDKKGKAIGGEGPPTFGFNWVDGPINPMKVVEGKAPRAADDVLLDTHTASKGGYKVGDTVTVVTDTGPGKYRVSGIGSFGTTGATAGATLTFFSPETAARVMASSGRFAAVDVVAKAGVSPDQLAADVSKVLPNGFEAVTTAEVARETTESFQSFVGIFRNVLLVFAGISLFVGAFIIFNAFQITIAQRGRQIGLLRSVGASSQQILGSVLLEALLVAVIASVIGVLFGIFVAWGLKALFNAAGASLPDQSMVVEPRSIIIGLAVGLVITLLAALGPAFRSSRVPPMAALHPVEAESTSRWRAAGAVAMTVVGIAMVVYGTAATLDTAPRSTLLAVGAILLFFGAAALTQYIARPLAAALGTVFTAIGGRTPARLGRRNAMRNPHRTAQTASALTIGVALVTAVSILGASLQATFVGTVEKRMRGDAVAFAQGPDGFSVAAEKAVADLPQVASISPWRNGQFKDLRGDTQQISGVDPKMVTPFYDAGVQGGAFADLARPDSVAVSKKFADANSLKLGDSMPMTFSLTGTAPRRIVAIFDDESFGAFYMDKTQLDANVAQPRAQFLLVKGAPGVSPEAVKQAMDKALTAFPSVKAYTKQGYVDFVGESVNQFLMLFYIMLAMAVVIAVFGIVLTLALSVFERTREIGLLRAVGLSRRGARSMIRWEAVIVSLIGAVVGLVVGTFLGIVAVKAFPDLTTIGIPWGRMALFVVLAGGCGVLAAILPARRAGKLKVLEAIATE